ncbi:MAG: 50S ribosomal protein L6 [Bdellovibrionales bacterium]|nr:50S ribosomal protein L6 [Bdellovibrionales bacterium]
MSRIGKQPIQIPSGVTVSVNSGVVKVQGSKGNLEYLVDERVSVEVKDSEILCAMKDESVDQSRARFGLVRSILSNMVEGCGTGFKKELQINGVGYRGQVSGRNLELALGFSHPVHYPIPDGIQIDVDKQGKVTIEGPNKQLVGQVAAEIRDFRPPEPYKGKGVKYADEVVRRKAGKSASS